MSKIQGSKVVAAPVKAAKVIAWKLDANSAKRFATTACSAFVKQEAAITKARATAMETVSKAAAFFGRGVTANEYDRSVGALLKASFAEAVTKGQMTEGSASKARSRVKACTLAILANVAVPAQGEGFESFYNRANVALKGATLKDGRAVYDATKAGKKAGGVRKGVGSKGGTSKGAQATVAKSEPSKPMTRDERQLQAALALVGDHPERARKLVIVVQSFVEELDKFMSTVIPADERKQAA
jgi:hypothetical protein